MALLPNEMLDTLRTMSQENVDLVKDVVEVLNTRGLEAALAYVHPEIAWYGPPGVGWSKRSITDTRGSAS